METESYLDDFKTEDGGKEKGFCAKFFYQKFRCCSSNNKEEGEQKSKSLGCISEHNIVRNFCSILTKS
jgi:hypothetical protein